MTQKIFRLSFFVSLIISLLPTCNAQVDLKRSYSLFNNSGKEITYTELIQELSQYEVVFLGEMHNCPITHWLEFEITKSLFALVGSDLMIGEEMMESDNQLILNEYLQGLISESRFETEARLWANYETDYAPVVRFAKENKIPLVATNIPRRYANSVSKEGFSILDSLSDEAKRYIAPLPIEFNFNADGSEAAFGLMQMFKGKNMGNSEYLSQAQAIKDATMAWFIAKNIKNKFLHINGNYHTDSKEGIIPYLLTYREGVKFVTVASVRQDSIDKLEEENKGRADFYICVPMDMVTSY